MDGQGRWGLLVILARSDDTSAFSEWPDLIFFGSRKGHWRYSFWRGASDEADNQKQRTGNHCDGE